MRALGVVVVCLLFVFAFVVQNSNSPLAFRVSRLVSRRCRGERRWEKGRSSERKKKERSKEE
jgi:hypothetical protein